MLAPRLLFLALFALVTLACGYRARVGEHDAGASRCSSDSDCASGEGCFCGVCMSHTVHAPPCDPCFGAESGGPCTGSEVCSFGSCEHLECRDGTFVRVVEPACFADGGGGCECPPPPVGCYYDGEPCECDRLTCPGGEHCGRAVCEPGTFCCNVSCGLCAPPGAGCPGVECAPDCSAMEARGEGSCGRPLGLWVWDGTTCTELLGCSCAGADCASAFPSRDACETHLAGCLSACSSATSADCGPTEYCDLAEPHECGRAREPGVCRGRPDVCPPVVREVCGCDGRSYASDCDALVAGVEVHHEGPCGAGCEPQDAVGTGDCDAVIAFAWNGVDCRPVTGCTCEGSDCGHLWRERDDCHRAHETCDTPTP